MRISWPERASRDSAWSTAVRLPRCSRAPGHSGAASGKAAACCKMRFDRLCMVGFAHRSVRNSVHLPTPDNGKHHHVGPAPATKSDAIVRIWNGGGAPDAAQYPFQYLYNRYITQFAATVRAAPARGTRRGRRPAPGAARAAPDRCPRLDTAPVGQPASFSTSNRVLSVLRSRKSPSVWSAGPNRAMRYDGRSHSPISCKKPERSYVL